MEQKTLNPYLINMTIAILGPITTGSGRIRREIMIVIGVPIVDIVAPCDRPTSLPTPPSKFRGPKSVGRLR